MTPVNVIHTFELVSSEIISAGLLHRNRWLLLTTRGIRAWEASEREREREGENKKETILILKNAPQTARVDDDWHYQAQSKISIVRLDGISK